MATISPLISTAPPNSSFSSVSPAGCKRSSVCWVCVGYACAKGPNWNAANATDAAASAALRVRFTIVSLHFEFSNENFMVLCPPRSLIRETKASRARSRRVGSGEHAGVIVSVIPCFSPFPRLRQSARSPVA